MISCCEDGNGLQVPFVLSIFITLAIAPAWLISQMLPFQALVYAVVLPVLPLEVLSVLELLAGDEVGADVVEYLALPSISRVVEYKCNHNPSN